ncbi:hypothetical protein MK628_004139 [Escherichia coli]|nr:hypothetical protein [Escherichia coli]
MNSEELTIIFNCVGWPDLGGGSAVSQFAMMARKFGKQLIVAVSEKDAIKLKANFDIIGGDLGNGQYWGPLGIRKINHVKTIF